MAWFDGLKALANAIDTEYDRRIRTASNVKEYHVGGHDGHAGHAPVMEEAEEQAEVVEVLHSSDHDGTELAYVDRLQGEGGDTGPLQASAGPQNEL